MQNRQQQPGQPEICSGIREPGAGDPEQLQRDPSADDLHQDSGAAAARTAGDPEQVPEISSQGGRDPLQSVKEGYNRLRGCIDAEHCEYMDCIYFENPEQLREVVCFLETAINRAEREQLQRVP